MKKLLLRAAWACALGLGFFSGPCWATPVKDGFYAVVKKEAVEGEHPSLPEGEERLDYDPSFLGDHDDPLKVVVDTRSVVEMLLKEPPEKRPDTTARTQFWLGVTLTDEAAGKFEAFTREHLGGTVAVVVGGRVITMHKIKSVITGGKIQISRCGDNGCQILYRELTDNVESK